MIFSVAEQIAFASRIMTLEPGYLNYVSTPSGVGLSSGRFPKPGDRVTAWPAGLGDLVNSMR